ncbi:MAG: VanW family protein [Pseudomonadales bacterium]|nr:VanW family protein [Pseudomonadales bacterium]
MQTKKTKRLGLVALLVALFLLFGARVVTSQYQTRPPPNIFINQELVQAQTYQELLENLSTKYQIDPNMSVVLSVDDIQVASSAGELGVWYPHESLVEQMQSAYESKNIWGKIRFIFDDHFYTLYSQLDEQKTTEFIAQLNTIVAHPGEEPSVELTQSGDADSIVVYPGAQGRSVDTALTTISIQDALQSPPASESAYLVAAAVASTGAELNEEEIEKARARAEQYVGVKQVLSHDTTTVTIKDTDIITLLNIPNGVDEASISAKIAEWNTLVGQPPQDAAFSYDPDTLVVTAFRAPQDGLQLEDETIRSTVQSILDNPEQYKNNPSPLPLPVTVAKPQKTLESTNNLGIVQRIGFGESWYAGSIPSRVHNVALASGRMNNYIVGPGAEFSFNEMLGDVSAESGFQSAYVIMNGQTVLGDGGGVCQVSTTLFRALLDAGLEITRRLPHSYRVGYYEQNNKPGFDATVYSGSVDLRFRNDTDNHILIHTLTDTPSRYLRVELYGTSDGRTTQLTEYKQWDKSDPLPTQYIPDPSLPSGTSKQIDWAVGGLKTSFVHTVKNQDGSIRYQNTYTSNYRPWAAKYLQGTGE